MRQGYFQRRWKAASVLAVDLKMGGAGERYALGANGADAGHGFYLTERHGGHVGGVAEGIRAFEQDYFEIVRWQRCVAGGLCRRRGADAETRANPCWDSRPSI